MDGRMDVTVSRSYAQHVVISPDAVVRIERRSAEETRRASYVTTFWAADLPEELAGLRGWPQVEAFRPVTVYPRRLIRRVELDLRGGLVLSLEREAAPRVALSVPPWDHRRFSRALEAAGYPIAAVPRSLIRSAAPR